MSISSNRSGDFRQGATDSVPVVIAGIPIGLLWGTLAAGKGLTAAETLLMSSSVYAGAAQFVAIEQWREPAPWLLLTVAAFIVNLRYILMGASLARHMTGIRTSKKALPMFLLSDEVWAFAERRALTARLTASYLFGLGVPMYLGWTTSSFVGALVGRTLGDSKALGFDFVFSAIFIGILSGFWKGSKTGIVIVTSGLLAAVASSLLPGAWYIIVGAVSGSAIAAALHAEEEFAG
jgi:4-azaleucine resistance transporter AzlC